METVFALATAHGKAGVAVIRISGPLSQRACGHLGANVPVGGRGVRRLMSSAGEVLDEALVLHFPKGQSFTGDEVVELHIHGSRAIISAVLSELGAVPGLSPAEPGAFTRRAFENGRLDLTQVEALADLIESETEAQRLQAQRVFDGGLRKKADYWHAKLLQIIALFTAGIDFADEEIPEDVADSAKGIMDSLIADFNQELSNSAGAERIRDGFEVAIIGPPNAGKSTLLNRIAGRDVAIVSSTAGTTRDVIEVRLELGGLPVTMLDTAGVRETTDGVESIGVKRAIQRAKNADMRIFLSGEGALPGLDPNAHDLVLAGKDDDGQKGGISGLTGAGVDTLLDQVTNHLSSMVGGAGLAIRDRHVVALRSAHSDLSEAKAIFETTGDVVIAAELVNSAIRAMDAMVGRVDVESVLGQIFSSFCVGK